MKFNNHFMNLSKFILALLLIVVVFGCSSIKQREEINIGFIGPLSKRATVLGMGPSKAIQLAIENYNEKKTESQPKINFFIEDDKWEKDLALPKYLKLKKEHDIDIVFVSNTDGTVAIQNQILQDDVICINSINNDQLLSSLNHNTFKIAKRTEVANGLVAHRILELGLKKSVIFHFPNDFMTRGAKAVKDILDNEGVMCKIITMKKDQVDFKNQLKECKDNGFDSYSFFGYKNLGFAMKQARDLGIDKMFFGSTTLLNQTFFNNSEGSMIGTEFPFFTTINGHKILGEEFFEKYKHRYKKLPGAEWPALQSYDAAEMIIGILSQVNSSKSEGVKLSDWVRKELFNTTYYEGVCGNLSIDDHGASRGVYFSMYKYVSEMKVEKLK